MDSFSQSTWPGWPYTTTLADPFSSAAYSQISNPNFPPFMTEPADYQAQQHSLLNHQMSRSTESKPRLSKDEVEILEAEFQKNHKPNSNTKKALAESMRVDNARINNWFQNRRAREKKEKNVRDYEAKQRQEKEQATADGVTADADHQHDLVASTAPFPSCKPNLQTVSTTASPESCVDDAAVELLTAGDAAIELLAADDATPSIETTPDLIPETVVFAKVGQESQPDDGAQDKLSAVESQDYLPISDATVNAMVMNEADLFMPMANSRPDQLFDADLQTMACNPNPADFFLSSPVYPGGLSTDASSFDMVDRDISISPSCQLSLAMSLKSPPCMDIATRRNKRPTPLSIATRTGVSGSGVPKTTMGFGLTRECTKFMRRTSSASSSGRITKPTATPRNMMRMHRSPSFNGVAPQTPGTPIVSNAHNFVDFSYPNLFAVDTKIPSLTPHDATLSTPPTTPGMTDGVVDTNAAFLMNLSDDYIINNGLSVVPDLFDMPNVSVCGFNNGNPLCAQHQSPVFQQQNLGQLGFEGSIDWSSS